MELEPSTWNTYRQLLLLLLVISGSEEEITKGKEKKSAS